jgi:flagellar biogenesis protein FliO
MHKIVLVFLSLALYSANVLAAITVKGLDFTAKDNQGTVTINFQGHLSDYPDFKIHDNSIHVIIPDAAIGQVINKDVNFSTNSKDTNLNAAKFTNNSVRVKVNLPFNAKDLKEKVALTLRDNKIDLSFPKLQAQAAFFSEVKAAPTDKTKLVKPSSERPTGQIAKDVLNEEYLNNLIAAEKNKKTKVLEPQKVLENQKDEVKTTQASGAKPFMTPAKSSFSLVEYGGKFVAFLGVVLLLFYGVIAMMKKGFIKKGRLGFLNKTEQVTVLSQTYIAPKKSLMLIRAHNQVFLVSNTDAGIHPISEIKDVAGLLKEGEKIIAGSNFDDSLGTASDDNNNDFKIKLKEDISESNKQSSLSDFIGVKDRVKFSDQIKNKVKNLKPLQ